MSKRAFIVIGPVSTGTRLTTQILLAAGCHGSAEHKQPFDVEPITEDPVVWRRSVPHGNDWHYPELGEMLAKLQGYHTTLVVTIRDMVPTVLSQAARHRRIDPAESRGMNRLAYRHVFAQLASSRLPFVLSVYESLILHPAFAQRALCRQLGLKLAEDDVVAVEDRDRVRWVES